MRVIFGRSLEPAERRERDAFSRFACSGRLHTRSAQAVTGASCARLAGWWTRATALGASGRYRVHELLRQFAKSNWRSRRHDAARAAHSAHYLDLLRRLEPDIKGERFFQAQAELSAELENLRTASCGLPANRPRGLAAGITALGIFFYTWDGPGFSGDVPRRTGRSAAPGSAIASTERAAGRGACLARAGCFASGSDSDCRGASVGIRAPAEQSDAVSAV